MTTTAALVGLYGIGLSVYLTFLCYRISVGRNESRMTRFLYRILATRQTSLPQTAVENKARVLMVVFAGVAILFTVLALTGRLEVKTLGK